MMDSSNGIMPVMPVGNGSDLGGNGFIWMFFLLVLLMGGGGFGWGNAGFANAIGYENLPTENSMQRAFDNQNNMANQRDILNAVTNGTAQTIAASTTNATNAISAIKDGNASLIREFGTVESALTALGGKQQECCCANLRAIDNAVYQDALNTAGINANIADSKYASALNTASINETTVAQSQKILDAIAQNKIDALTAKVNELQLAQATAGMLKFPQSWSYNGGYFPPIYGCGCQQNI